MTHRSLPAALLLVAAALPTLLAPAGVAGQEPPDTLPPDTVIAVPDSLAPDTLPRDTVDTVPALPDSLDFDSLPRLRDGAPAGAATGVWVWDREALLSTRALTLTELLDQIPGVIALRGGDYGTPEGVTAFGLGGGRVRVFWDGFELLPLDGGVADLARVGLGGLEQVRVERGLGEMRVELESLRAHDGRPLSVVEAGTGDLETNQFRGTFVHPRALGGSIGLALERLDTQGPGGVETGSRQGGWLRYTYHLGDRAGIRAEFRQASAQSDLDLFPDEVTRRDWVVRARAALGGGVVGEAFTGRSSLESPWDSLTPPIGGARWQHGVRASWHADRAWARGAFRLLGGPDVPSTSLEAQAGLDDARWGGVSGTLARDTWQGTAATLLGVRAWTPPLLGLRGFASWESGERGARLFPERVPFEAPEPPPEGEEGEEVDPSEPVVVESWRLTDRTGLRVGGTFDLGPLSAFGALLRQEADSLLPLGLLTDRGGVVLPGFDVSGWEAGGRLGLPLEGLSLYGSLQTWEEEARYLPEQTYRGGVHFHDTFFPTRNLEIWADVGVQGRESMLLPLADPGAPEPGPGEPPTLVRVPFYQAWNGFLQIRVVTVRVYLRFENFTLRENLQDFPGRILPPNRATYGVRWTLWN